MNQGDHRWVRDKEKTWCLCMYWDRTKDGDRFYVVADLERVIHLPPDSCWIKELTPEEATAVQRIVNRRQEIAREDDELFTELADMSFKED